ncbi:MAG: hypothetical protein Q9168_002499 [Polycauliona sp. 1 TL-2023]
MARPMDAHPSSTANMNPRFFSTSLAANHAWDSSFDSTSYPASIKYGDAAPTLSVAGTTLTSTKNQRGLRLAKIKSSPSHGALAAARTASRQPRRLHRRGRSASETTSPVTPTFTSPYAPPRHPHEMTTNTKFAMPPPATFPKTKVKIKPLLRKLSSPDQKTIDLSKSVAENEGLGIYTSSEVGDSRKASSEMGYAGRSYHNRTISGTSHISTTTTSSHHKHSAQYVHPMRQTPLPYTPPVVGSFANSLESGISTGAPPTIPHELIHPDLLSQPNNKATIPYAPLPSPRRAQPPPLHIRTGSAPRLASTSQINLPGTPSSLRKQTSDNKAGLPAMPASTRTSFDSMFRFRSRANTNEDPVVRAAQVAVLRKEFDERERLKDELRREQEAKKASREAKKQAKRDESEQRKSESRARKRAQSNTMSEKSATRAAYQAQQEKSSVPTSLGGTTTPGGPARRKGATPASAGKALVNRWQLFVFWLKTVWLKLKRAMGIRPKG